MCNAHKALDGLAHGTHGFFLTLSALDKVLAHVFSARWAQAIPLHLLTFAFTLGFLCASLGFYAFQWDSLSLDPGFIFVYVLPMGVLRAWNEHILL